MHRRLGLRRLILNTGSRSMLLLLGLPHHTASSISSSISSSNRRTIMHLLPVHRRPITAAG